MIDASTLDRLNNLELEQYAGNLNAFTKEDLIMRERLAATPIDVKMIEPRGVCDDELYDICSPFEGRQETFASLRQGIVDRLRREIEPILPFFQWNLLTVLFDGVYVGEPEDLLDYRKGNEQGILPPIEGLGKKIADIKFLTQT